MGDTLDSTINRRAVSALLLREIQEQPAALANALAGRLDEADATCRFDGLNLDPRQLRHAERLILTGCGTSYHAALVGEYLLEELARLPVEVEFAGEFRYRDAPVASDTVVLALSQSGETEDTLAALHEARRRGLPTLAVCNLADSPVARAADGLVSLNAGPTAGRPSIKAFTSQVAVLFMLALHFGRLRQLSWTQGTVLLKQLAALPELVRRTLDCEAQVRRIVARYAHAHHFLYLGRKYLYPVALEGAWKLKELSRLHAEGYPAAEMEHGPIALVDDETPSLFLCPRGDAFGKAMSNLEAVKAQGGPVIAVTNEGDAEIAARVDDVIPVPVVPDWLQPLVTVVPLQLFAYYMAQGRNGAGDRARGTARSAVTV